ncbi:MAG: hypothetical protein E7174_00585 [Firmicutes bacterium]|nr:hypothetical protein [Bacillota bacterium]
MKSIIVNIRREKDLFEKYSNKVSNDLLKYLVEEARVKDDIEIIINTKLDINNIDKLIKDGLENSYKNTKIIDKFYDNKQIILFIVGMLFLIFSTITQPEIIKELILIIGWVAVWEVVDIAINVDSKQKYNRKIIKKLINCKIKVNNN